MKEELQDFDELTRNNLHNEKLIMKLKASLERSDEEKFLLKREISEKDSHWNVANRTDKNIIENLSLKID